MIESIDKEQNSVEGEIGCRL